MHEETTVTMSYSTFSSYERGLTKASDLEVINRAILKIFKSGEEKAKLMEHLQNEVGYRPKYIKYVTQTLEYLEEDAKIEGELQRKLRPVVEICE